MPLLQASIPPPVPSSASPKDHELRRILHMQVPIIVRLAERKLTLAEVLRLGAGAILEFSKTAEDRETIDHEIDARTRRLADESDDFVIDARLGWHFIPHSFKVFLEVTPDVAAGRIYLAQRGYETENITLEETRRAIEERTRSERKRYRRYYGLDYADHDHYDLVIDTSEISIDEVVQAILDGLPAS